MAERQAADEGVTAMGFEPALAFLDGAPLGLFGAGHLGRAIAAALLRAGWPRAQLRLCHGGSPATQAALAQEGLADLTVTPQTLRQQAKLVFYLVRPQNAAAITKIPARADAQVVSFVAGIARDRIGADVRAMISDPDTLQKKNGIAALYPDHAVAAVLLETLGMAVLRLPSEESFHAFTAMGPCLPMAAAWCLGHGVGIDRDSLVALGERYRLDGYPRLIAWALEVCPKGLSRPELETYLRHAATPGGITEAVLKGLAVGNAIAAALECGIRRGEELARG